MQETKKTRAGGSGPCFIFEHNQDRRRRTTRPASPPNTHKAVMVGSGTDVATMKLSTRSVPPVPTVPPPALVVDWSTERIEIVVALSKAPPKTGVMV
jgi:hypothetical protein